MTDNPDAWITELPAELQAGGEMYTAVERAVGPYIAGESMLPARLNMTEDVMRALAPLLWPLLPSNDHSAAGHLAAVERPKYAPVAVVDPAQSIGGVHVAAVCGCFCDAWVNTNPASDDDLYPCMAPAVADVYSTAAQWQPRCERHTQDYASSPERIRRRRLASEHLGSCPLAGLTIGLAAADIVDPRT